MTNISKANHEENIQIHKLNNLETIKTYKLESLEKTEITRLSNNDLLTRMKQLSSEDRKLQILFLKHLKEVEQRKLFLKIGFGSLFEYVVQDLGYSESTAYRRIEAARLLQELPQIEEKIKSGALTLNAAAQVQTFFKKLKKQEKLNLVTTFKSDLELRPSTTTKLKSGIVPLLSKSELITQVENKSSRDIEKHLLSLAPEIQTISEKVRSVSKDLTEIKLIFNEEQKQRLDELKLLLSHVNSQMTYHELIDHLCHRALKQLKPKVEKKDSKLKPRLDSELNPNLNLKSRYIPALIKSNVYRRDNGCCSYIHPETHKKCGSKFQLQLDHIHPFSLGGSNVESNLRLLCSSHNRYRAEKTFGVYKPSSYKADNTGNHFQR